jgi:hypothetical protein
VKPVPSWNKYCFLHRYLPGVVMPHCCALLSYWCIDTEPVVTRVPFSILLACVLLLRCVALMIPCRSGVCALRGCLSAAVLFCDASAVHYWTGSAVHLGALLRFGSRSFAAPTLMSTRRESTSGRVLCLLSCCTALHCPTGLHCTVLLHR